MRAIDLFAGAGGFTHGAKLAGVDMVWAANHWPLAVQVHEANHPDVQHAVQDLRQFDFSTLPAFDLLLASPACQGSSRCGRPGRAHSTAVAKTHNALRSTAWAVIDALEVCRPKFVIVENVPEMMVEWLLLPDWLSAMRRLGYTMTQQVLCASYRGVPQRRERVFFVGHLEGEAIELQNPDVAEPDLFDVFEPEAGKWVRIEDMRVTESKRGAPVARDRLLYANDKLRGAAGWGQHVSHRGAWGRPLTEPVNTITTKAIGQLWWVHEGRYRLWTQREVCKAMTFPPDYSFGGMKKSTVSTMLGNAVPPRMAASIISEVVSRA